MTVSVRGFLLPGGLLAMLASCGVTGSGAQTVHDPNTPGWTGRTVVVGSHSTIAGDAAATEQQQKWPMTPGR